MPVTTRPNPHPKPTIRLSSKTTLVTTQQQMAMTMGLAISMISKRARRATTILGTLTMGFSKAKTRQRLHLLSPQINLLYLPLHQVL